jgi:hypothetical protein
MVNLKPPFAGKSGKTNIVALTQVYLTLYLFGFFIFLRENMNR